MKRIPTRIAVVFVLSALVVLAGGLAVRMKAQEAGEKFHANLMTWGTAGGKSTRLNMTVDRWVTEEDLAGFKKVLSEGGPNELYKVLAGRNMGSIKTNESYIYPIYLAFSITTEKGRTVKLLTERPVFAKEMVRQQDTLDYIYSYIELDLGAKGKGSGTMLGTARVVIDKNGKVDIETHGQPQQLVNAGKD